jgi:hypothetical protein
MILDAYNEFCDAVSVAGNAGTALVGNVIDLGSTTNYPGNSDDLYLVVNIDTEVITAANAGTISFKLASDAQAGIAVDGTATLHYTSAASVTNPAGTNSDL